MNKHIQSVQAGFTDWLHKVCYLPHEVKGYVDFMRVGVNNLYKVSDDNPHWYSPSMNPIIEEQISSLRLILVRPEALEAVLQMVVAKDKQTLAFQQLCEMLASGFGSAIKNARYLHYCKSVLLQINENGFTLCLTPHQYWSTMSDKKWVVLSYIEQSTFNNDLENGGFEDDEHYFTIDVLFDKKNGLVQVPEPQQWFDYKAWLSKEINTYYDPDYDLAEYCQSVKHYDEIQTFGELQEWLKDFGMSMDYVTIATANNVNVPMDGATIISDDVLQNIKPETRLRVLGIYSSLDPIVITFEN